LIQAVATRLVERAERVGVESCDIVFATERVVLEDLVGSVEGAAANDPKSMRSSTIKATMEDWHVLTVC
jgi:hypothetical protein